MDQLLEKLNHLNVQLRLKDNNLNIEAPKGVVNKELLEEIKYYKLELISFLKDHCHPISIPEAKEADYYPLSSAQKRLWMIYQMNPQDTAYHISMMLEVEGILNLNRLQKTFELIIDKHESLRTVFRDDGNGNPVQIIKKGYDSLFRINIIENIEQNEDAEIQKLISQPFDLSEDSLLRVYLFRYPEGKYKLLIVMHHIISDGWSIEVLAKDFIEGYTNLKNNPSYNFEKLSIQYKDYAVWESDQINKGRNEKAKEYWLSVFSEKPPVLELPVSLNRPKNRSGRGKTISFQFDHDKLTKLRGLCSQNRTTLFVGLVTLIDILLYKYSDQNDIIIGIPIANRDQSELQNQIGFYANTLALYSKVDASLLFVNLLNNNRKTLLNAYKYQKYPFEELASNLNLEYVSGKNSLFNVMISLQEKMDIEMLKIDELRFKKLILDDQTSKFDLVFTFYIDNENLNLLLNYDTDIYSEKLCENLLKHCNSLLDSIIDNEHVTIGQLDYLTQEERHRLIVEFNNTNLDYLKDKTIIRCIEEQVEKTPGNIAIVFENIKFTYSELNEYANQLGDYLRQYYQIQSDDLIAVKLAKSEKMIIAILGILKSGAAYVPIDSEYPRERVEYIKQDAKAKTIIDESFFNEFEKIRENYSKGNLSQSGTCSDLAYVIYTSGTTGQPKGVMIENKSLVNLCEWHNLAYHVSESSKTILFSGQGFDASVWEIFPYLIKGAALYPLPNNIKFDFDLLGKFLNDKSITHAYLPPVVIKELIKRSISLHNTIILTGGEALGPVDTKEFIVYNNYGPTENTVVSTFFKLDNEKEYSNVPIGRPISNTQVYILDDNLNLVPVGVIGKLYVAGLGLARGYLNKPGLTAEKFINNPFLGGDRMYDTGDLARWLPDGNLQFLGRKDHQVKIRGFRIELGEIEIHLLQYSSRIKQVVADLVEVNEERVLVAYYTVEEGVLINKMELRRYLQNKLPDYMVPSFFVELEDIPLTHHGKIDRGALPQITEENLIEREYLAPRNEIEQKIAVIWQEILGIGKVGISDNFFELGGNSLKVFSFKSRLEKEYAIELNLVEFFCNPTIFCSPKYLKDVDKINELVLAPVNDENIYAVSSIQQTMWIQSQYENLSKLYNIPMGLYINDDTFNPEVIQDFFKLLMEHNESFRTVFLKKDAQIMQKILSFNELEFQMDFFDLSDEPNPIEIKNSIIREKRSKIFELDKFPLFSITYLKFNSSKHYILLVIHHIISDATTIKLLYELFNDFYSNKKVFLYRLKENQIQYKDYSYWLENREPNSGELDFWKSRLSSEIEPLELPLDCKRQQNISYNGTSYEFIIESSDIRSLVKQEKVTPFTFFVTVFSCFLYEITGQHRFLIGTPFSTRVRAEFENVLGCLLNTIVLNIALDTESTLKYLLQTIHTELLYSFQNGTCPFSKIVEELGVKKRPDRNLLFDVMIDMIDADLTSSNNVYEKIVVDNFNETLGSKCDLIIYIIEREQDYKIIIEYNDLLFCKETICYFQETFEKIIEQFNDNLNVKLADFNDINLKKISI